ncbi:MAG TPA: TRAP transporter substrate-binding protein DctP [Alphaproteobacteria bacterium]
MRTTIATVAALAAIALAPANAPADEMTLKFATLDSPMAHLNVHIFHPWAKRMNEIGKGVLKIDVRDGPAVANHGNVYQRVIDDVVQIGWGLHSSVAGKFRLTEAISLPLIGDRSAVASVAFWRLYKSGILDSEFDQVVMLRTNIFPPSTVQFRAKPPTIETLEGRKMAITGGEIVSSMVKSLGGAPLSFRPGELYEVLQRGTADGAIIGWTAFQPFKLAEVTSYHIDMPMSANSGQIFMSKPKWAALPAAVRNLIAANATEKESREFGVFWDRVREEGIGLVRGKPGHTVVEPSPEMIAKWRQRFQPITDEWLKKNPGGDKVLAEYKRLLAQVAAGS